MQKHWAAGWAGWAHLAARRSGEEGGALALAAFCGQSARAAWAGPGECMERTKALQAALPGADWAVWAKAAQQSASNAAGLALRRQSCSGAEFMWAEYGSEEDLDRGWARILDWALDVFGEGRLLCAGPELGEGRGEFGSRFFAQAGLREKGKREAGEKIRKDLEAMALRAWGPDASWELDFLAAGGEPAGIDWGLPDVGKPEILR